MNSKEIIKRLEQEGWINVGGKGDHEKFKHPEKPGHVVVPHPRKDMRLELCVTYINKLVGNGGKYVVSHICP